MTQSTMTYDRGDIVFVPFMFTDKPVAKNRPAVIISSSDYHVSRREIVIAAITSQIRRPLFVGDYEIKHWQDCGLPKPSVATGILWTIKARLIGRVLGRMSSTDMHDYERALSHALGL